MKKELKEKVQIFFKEHSDISLVYKEFSDLVYRDTLKRWCYPEKSEEARLRAKTYHQKNKDNPEYKEKQRLRAEQKRKTTEYQEFRQSYYEKNKEKIQENIKKHRQKNLDHYLQKTHQHYQNNKERYKQWSKEYRLKNKDHLQSLELKRYHEDPITHLKQSLRMSLNRALKHGKNIKTNKALSYLGCTIEEFKIHLENQFKEEMSWDNRLEWHLDHFIPLDKISEGYTLEQLCHFSNIRPLWKKDNLSKGNRLNLELKYTSKQLEQEKNFYTFSEGNYEIIPPKNKIVLNYQSHFYEIERQLWEQKDIQEKILRNRSHYLNKPTDQLTPAEILRGFKISGVHYGYSHFSPLWFKKFLTDYSIQSVYDPCGGWGHRILGLLGTSVKKYIYNDFDPRTVYAVKEIINFLNLNSVVEIHNQKSQYWSPASSVQCIFTCPPYFNKETYNHKNFKNLEDYSFWWNQVVEQCLKLNPSYFGVIIDSDHLNIISQPLSNYSLIFQQELSKNSSHLSKHSSSYEMLLVFSLRNNIL